MTDSEGSSLVRKFLKIVFVLLIALSLIWLVLFLWPSGNEVSEFNHLAENRKRENAPLVIAHRGGAGIAPESTIEAMDKSVEMGVDMLEFDVHLTSDHELVVLHDASVDRTTDGSGNINDMTLSEAQELDAGFRYVDEDGEHSYRNQGVIIPSLREVFERYPEQLYLIEIKDTNYPKLYDVASKELWALIEEYGIENQVTVGSFTHDILEDFREISNNQVAIGAGETEAEDFVIKSIARLNGLIKTNAASLQLPLEQRGIDLTGGFIRQTAHDKAMHVYYWTINEVEDMNDLIDKNVDGIMTDHPDRLLELIDD